MTRYLSIALAAFSIFLISLFGYTLTVGPDDIQKNAVRARHIKKNSVKSSDIRNGAIRAKDLASGAVTTRKLANEAVNATKIESGAVGTAELADESVQVAKLHPSTRPGGALPSDIMLTGIVAAGINISAGVTRSNRDAVSFAGYQMPQRPIAHVVPKNASTPSAACPGTVSAPKALSGHLCVYLDSVGIHVDLISILDTALNNGYRQAVSSAATTDAVGDGKVSKNGFVVIVQGSDPASSFAGSWAVKS